MYSLRTRSPLTGKSSFQSSLITFKFTHIPLPHQQETDYRVYQWYLLQMDFPWKSDIVLQYFQTFLDVFQLPVWLGRLDLTTYLVFFYIAMFVICLVILDIVYVSYSFSQKKLSFVWPLQALRSVCGLFVTVLFLPFLGRVLKHWQLILFILLISTIYDFFLQICSPLLIPYLNPFLFIETFTSVMTCKRVNEKFVNTLFEDLECWTGLHLLHTAFAVVVSIIFIAISIVVAMTYFDSQSTSNDPTARVNSKGELFYIYEKIVLTYIYAFVNGQDYHWPLIVILFVMSYIGYTTFSNHWPYYNDKMTIYMSVIAGIYVWGNICLILTKILENAPFNGALQLYFLGLPLVIAFLIYKKDKRIELLLQNLNNFQKGEDVALQIRYFLHLVVTKDSNRRSAIILKGYIFHHEDSCPNSDCHLKLYKEGALKKPKEKNSSNTPASKSQSLDNYQLLLQHAKSMYRSGIQKFPSCTSLKIQYAFFLMERLNKKNEALNELKHVQKFNPTFDEQFIIYRYKKLSEDYGDGAEGSNTANLDVVQKFAYESSFRQLQQHIERSAALHLEFWNGLSDDRPDLAKLNKWGSKINNSIAMVESYWGQLQKLNSNVPKALIIYAKFLIEILNDKDTGQELLSRAKDTTNIKQNYETNNVEDGSDIISASANGTPCIYVQGDNNRVGVVTNCNQGASRIFGYSNSEIVNHSVEKLMPEMYAKHHAKVLDNALAKGAENIINKDRLVFARHRSGYVFPVWLQLKMINSIQAGIQFLALFKIDKKIMSSDVGFFLLNKDKRIQGITSSCMKMINLDLLKLRRLSQNGIGIKKLAPSLFDDSLKEFAFPEKQGGTIDWFLADYEKKNKNKNKLDVSAQVSESQSPERQNNDKKLVITSQKVQFSCHLSPITMGDQGDIGWYLKLETLQNKKQPENEIKKSKGKEMIKQPFFQFRYSEQTGKYIREIRSEMPNFNGAKNPCFVNGDWKELNTGTGAEESSQDINNEEQRNNNNQSADIEEVKIEIDETKAVEKARHDLLNENLFEQKRRWSRNIVIYRLKEGKFLHKDHDEEIKKEKEAEEAQRKKIEEEEKEEEGGQRNENFKNNIKSRKALHCGNQRQDYSQGDNQLKSDHELSNSMPASSRNS